MYHSTEYNREFWNAMRGKPVSYNYIESGKNTENGNYRLPIESGKKFAAARKQENIFRQIATVVKAPKGDSTIWAFDNEPVAKWIDKDNPEFFENMEDFQRYKITGHQLGSTILLGENFCNDAGFDLEDHLTKEFARCIGQAEEEAFIASENPNAPGGFLKDAVVDHTTGEITYDDVIKLYFSLDKRYRRRAVWIMNDETALKLRTLKDSAGNYLWNQQDNTMLGKRVHISNYMPGEAAGAKPIAFGDFRYFWIIDRWPFEMCRLTELFALQQQVGFIGQEYLDAKLIRPEAIHVMQITA